MTNLEKFVQNIKDGILPEETPKEVRGYMYNMDLPDRKYKDGDLDLLSSWKARCECTNRGMWAIVDKKWTKYLARWIGDRKCLEVMAGAGWLSNALNHHGIDIVATDDFSWEKQHKDMKIVYDVQKMSGVDAVKKFSDRDVLIISWPPYDDDEICRISDHWGTDKPIVYIGEDDGGCNAPSSYWSNFQRLDDQPDFMLPQWDGLHDYVVIGNWTRLYTPSPLEILRNNIRSAVLATE